MTFFKKEMISLVRLDERMIHGQVAVKWSRVLNVDRILVISDQAASDKLVQQSLMMAAPNTVKTAIKSVRDALKLLKDPRMAEHKVLVIVSTPQDLLTVLKEIDGIKNVNIGNYGRIAKKENGMARKRYQQNLYLYDNEADILSQCVIPEVKIQYQTMPDDSPVSLMKLLK